MSLPQCIEGCPQHESTHKTRVRYKQRHRSRTVSKTSLRGVEAGSRRMRVQEILGKDVHNMRSLLTLLLHKKAGGPPEVFPAEKTAKNHRKAPGVQGVPGKVGGVQEGGISRD